MSALRSCATCTAHILTADTTSQMAFCTKCRPKHVTPHDQWAAALKPGDRVYVQPCIAWRGLSRSQYLIVDRRLTEDRHGRPVDEVTVQVLGIPESRFTTTTAQLGQHDLTPRGRAL